MLELLYEALRSPLGIVVQSEDPEALRARLYKLRVKDPELACLSFVISPLNPTSDLWILRKPDERRPTSEGDA